MDEQTNPIDLIFCDIKFVIFSCHKIIINYECLFLDDLSNTNEWNPDIISGVVRPPEQIKLVHDAEAIRSVSSSSSSSGRVPLQSSGGIRWWLKGSADKRNNLSASWPCNRN